MKNKGVKIAIIILILTIIIISIKLVNLKKSMEPEMPNAPTHNSEDYVLESNVKKVSIKNDYFVIKNITDSYYSYCNKIMTSKSDIEQLRLNLTEKELQRYLEEEQDIAKENLYNMLNESYINEFGITQDNIIDKFRYTK